MSLKDASRILRNVNLSYESQENIFSFALEVLEYEVRLLDAIIWWYPHSIPDITSLLSRLEGVLTTFWSITWGLGQSIYQRFKSLMRYFSNL